MSFPSFLFYHRGIIHSTDTFSGQYLKHITDDTVMFAIPYSSTITRLIFHILKMKKLIVWLHVCF